MYRVQCPYCQERIIVKAPAPSVEGSELNHCTYCHRPIAVYSQVVSKLRHTDRSVQPLCVAANDSDEDMPWLECIDNQFTKAQELSIPIGVKVLGRYNKDSDADLQIYSADPSLGRNHSRLHRTHTNLMIEDNDSNTGTYVNSTLLAKGERRRLYDGDVLTLGALSLIVHLPNEEEPDIDLSDFDI